MRSRQRLARLASKSAHWKSGDPTIPLAFEAALKDRADALYVLRRPAG